MKKQSIWNREFITIFIINFVANMSNQMVTTLVPKYAASLGAAAALVGTISGLYAIFALVIRPITGPAIISMNNKTLLTISYGLYALSGMILFAFEGIPAIVVSRILSGFGMGFGITTSLVIATDSLPENKIASGLGIFSLAQALAQSIGPSLGLKLIVLIGYRWTFGISMCGNLLTIGMAFLLKLPEKEKKPFKISFRNMIAVEALKPAAILLLLGMAYSTFSSFLVLYAESKGIENAGTFFTVYAVFLLVSKPVAGMLSDRFGKVAVVIPAVILFAASFILIAMADSLTMLLIAAGVAAIGYGSCQPTMQTMCMQSVPKERRGAASSTNYTGTDIGHFLGPALAGVLVQAKGYSSMFLLQIVPVVIAVAVFFIVKTPVVAEDKKAA